MTSKETPRIAPDSSGAREVVLPSGRYARLRVITPFDMITCYSENPFSFSASVMVSAVTIDEAPVTVDTLKNMSIEEASPIYTMIAEALKDAMKFQGGIK